MTLPQALIARQATKFICLTHQMGLDQAVREPIQRGLQLLTASQGQYTEGSERFLSLPIEEQALMVRLCYKVSQYIKTVKWTHKLECPTLPLS